MTLLNAITDGFTSMVGWVGTVISAIFGTAATGTTAGSWAELAAPIGIAIAMWIIYKAISIIKSVTVGY